MHTSMLVRNVRRAAKLALAAASLTGTIAFATEANTVKLQIYRPGDALQTKEVYRVIQSAARQVCQPLESRDLGRMRYYMRCVNQAVSMAVAQVHSDQLTAFYLAQHGSEPARM
jgi:UrcA family protein